MGDTINLASRLEGMNKVYGTTILISQAVHDGCGPDFVTRLHDTVQLKHRAEAIVYELVESRAKEISTITSTDMNPLARCKSLGASPAGSELPAADAIN